MAAAQPGFVDAARAGINKAREACCADGAGNSTHPAVQSWGRFTMVGLKVNMLRALDPLQTTLERKLVEIDLVECWAWWLVTQQGVNTETAWQYVSTVNAWHDRSQGIGFAGGMDLKRVKNMLTGLQRLSGLPITRRKRIDCRPAHLGGCGYRNDEPCS